MKECWWNFSRKTARKVTTCSSLRQLLNDDSCSRIASIRCKKLELRSRIALLHRSILLLPPLYPNEPHVYSVHALFLSNQSEFFLILNSLQINHKFDRVIPSEWVTLRMTINSTHSWNTWTGRVAKFRHLKGTLTPRNTFLENFRGLDNALPTECNGFHGILHFRHLQSFLIH